MANDDSQQPEKFTTTRQAPAGHRFKVVPSSTLFAGAREIEIEHAGERYRLRITSRNKLVLQK